MQYERGHALVFVLPLSLFFLLHALSLPGEELIFHSNEIGMPLEAIRPGETVRGYRLVVQRSPGIEIRRLLNGEGVEEKRWEILVDKSGNPQEKNEYKAGMLQRRILYGPGGRILREEEFENGKMVNAFEYLYTATRYKGAVSKPLSDGSGYEDEILYTPGGSYRGVRRRYDSGAISVTLASQSKGLLQREVYQGQGITFLARYNSRGDVILQEVRKEGSLVERSRFRYSDSPRYHLEYLEVENWVAGTRKEVWYSPAGLIERELEKIHDVFIQETRYTHEEGRLIRMERRTRESRYIWEYRYTEDGKKVEEKQYENGVLTLHLDFSPPEPYSRIESWYKEGELVMRKYFEGDSEVQIEYYRNGGVVRTVRKGAVP
ncbi:MAG: hypothetical protein Kow009_07120 [Spirochaetales bacterium]